MWWLKQMFCIHHYRSMVAGMPSKGAPLTWKKCRKCAHVVVESYATR